ncbi:putative sepiapterin reductase [Neospora caninum Liverpool]|uniref:Putative sepiapterin reductase n=1 Tax=Neospora caninum (strain Liverpool) TaxID=572307 RepID=F0VI45_NEOCL|nr:putative sepiapterin reductase [Neospora caninum Liverpool]CBZ53406.1 putative sepiapterin reductase [Neospora caninum Liverpool]|eukprot:XP_003883438.1 putative sepiapterin reductase [Neospora caninum Liverpool]
MATAPATKSTSGKETGNLFPSKSLVFLIGSSKGCGRSVALEAEKKWRDVQDRAELKLVLIGRDEHLMQEKLGRRQRRSSKRRPTPSTTASVNSVFALGGDALDVGVVDDAFEKRVDDIFASESFADFDALYGNFSIDVCVLSHLQVHFNTQLHVDTQPTCYLQKASSADIRRSIDLNFTFFSILNSRFLHCLLETVAYGRKPGVVRILQISSLAGVQPFPSLPLCCAVKAARDMLMRVVATEIKACGNLRMCDLKTLNWAPGHSASLMWKLVAADTFESGDHVDVFDVIKSL